MNPNDIRAVRQELGLSQQKLSTLVGCSQATISLLERGKLVPDTLTMRKIANVLSPNSGNRPNATASVEDFVHQLAHTTKLLTPPPQQGLPPGLSIRQWQRPDLGGDLAVTYVRRDGKNWTVSVVAVDLAGSGPSLMQASSYFRGWIRGLLEAQPQQALGLMLKLSSECRRLEISASASVVVLSGDERRKRVDIDTITSAFPTILLIEAHPMKSTLLSASGPALPLRDDEYFEVQKASFESGRLLITTDGLLERLGAGDQIAGRRKLVKHMTSPKRHMDVGSWLGTEAHSRDDELGIVVTYMPWDIDETFPVRDDYSRHRVLSRVCEVIRLGALLPSAEGQLQRSDLAISAVAEALDNVRAHARGSGEVTVRALATTGYVRLEIQDDGIGPPTSRDIDQKASGFATMQHAADLVYIEESYPTGTLVGLVFNNSHVINA